MESVSSSTAVVDCPYCGEPVEIPVEEDLEGEMVHDCEVCCNPWRLTVRRGREGLEGLCHPLQLPAR